jgi:hypothetical protein
MNGVQSSVPRAPSGNDSSIALRVPEAWLKRADALRTFLSSRPGIELSRSDILRAALARGLEALEVERDAKPTPTDKRRK